MLELYFLFYRIPKMMTRLAREQNRSAIAWAFLGFGPRFPPELFLGFRGGVFLGKGAPCGGGAGLRAATSSFTFWPSLRPWKGPFFFAFFFREPPGRMAFPPPPPPPPPLPGRRPTLGVKRGPGAMADSMIAWLPDLIFTGARFESGLALVCNPSGRIERLARIDELKDEKRISLPKRALLPGMVNAHSHAFQRVLRGRTEYRRTGSGKTVSGPGAR